MKWFHNNWLFNYWINFLILLFWIIKVDASILSIIILNTRFLSIRMQILIYISFDCWLFIEREQSFSTFKVANYLLPLLVTLSLINLNISLALSCHHIFNLFLNWMQIIWYIRVFKCALFTLIILRHDNLFVEFEF